MYIVRKQAAHGYEWNKYLSNKLVRRELGCDGFLVNWKQRNKSSREKAQRGHGNELKV